MTDNSDIPVSEFDTPREAGRPTKFDPSYPALAYKLCLLGATDLDLAEFFEVCKATINKWKLDYPEFAVQLRAGKKIADMHIANKLFNRAEGAEWTEEQAIKIKEEFFDESGKKIRTEERVEIVEVRKGAPPDTTAIIFWLKNRDPAKWRDRQALEHSGPDGGPIPTASTIVTGDELKALIRQAEQDV